MSNCGCEGSCPVCRLGEVDNHKCDRCRSEFCPKCHGLKNRESPNVNRCQCEIKGGGMFDDPDSIIRDLRWREDMKVINPFGEHIWLKPLFVDGSFNSVEPQAPDAHRIGITDCCFVASPCLYHARMERNQKQVVNN